MKLWILLIFKMAKKVKKLVKYIENKIEKTAFDAMGDTLAQYKKVLDLYDMKIKLLNLVFLYDRFKTELNGQEFFLLTKYSSGKSMAELSEILCVSKKTIYRWLNLAFAHAEEILINMSLSDEIFERDYEGVIVVGQCLRTLSNKVKRRDAPPMVEETQDGAYA